MVAELNEEADAPDSVLDGARRLTHVVVHEPTVWVVGDETSDHASRYLVRVTMPGAWNNKDMGGYLIPRITSALAAVDPDPDRLYREPRAWVQLVGLKEGSLGASGQVMTITDITRLITRDYREPGEPVAIAAPGQRRLGGAPEVTGRSRPQMFSTALSTCLGNNLHGCDLPTGAVHIGDSEHGQ